MRRSLEVLFLLIIIGLCARSFVRTRPLIHSFQLACYSRPYSYQFDAQADGSKVHWQLAAKYNSGSASQRGEWTVDEWNEQVSQLANHGLFELQSHLEGTGHSDAYSVQADQGPKVQFTEDWPNNRAFVEFIPKTEINLLAHTVIDRAKQQHECGWQSQRFRLRTAPADKIVGFLSGQYKDAEFKMESDREFTVRSDRETLAYIEADLPNLDRIHHCDRPHT